MDENALQCPNCGVAVLANASYCINCGIRLPVWEAVAADDPTSGWGNPPPADEPVIALGASDMPDEEQLDTASAWLRAEESSQAHDPDEEPADDGGAGDEVIALGVSDAHDDDVPDYSGVPDAAGAETVDLNTDPGAEEVAHSSEDLLLGERGIDQVLDREPGVAEQTGVAELWLVSTDDELDDDGDKGETLSSQFVAAQRGNASEARERAEALLDELKDLLPLLTDQTGPDADSGGIREAALAARGERSFDDFAALREVIAEALGRPRDIETILQLSQRVEDLAALLAERDRLHRAFDEIIDRLDSGSGS